MSDGSKNGASDGLGGDTLLASICFLVGLTLIQRLIGFGRNVLFCGLLQDDELGRWSLAFNFLLLAAPLAVLGVPGSFGRYVEHFRQRGQFRGFLWRTTLPTLSVAWIVPGRCWSLLAGSPGFCSAIQAK